MNSSSGIRKLLSRCELVLVLLLLFVVVVVVVVVVVFVVGVEMLDDVVVIGDVMLMTVDADDNGVETCTCPLPGDGGTCLGLHGIV